MDYYGKISSEISRLMYKDLADIVLSYIEDPIPKWQKNNYKLVLNNIEEWGELEEKYRHSDIRNQVELYTSHIQEYQSDEKEKLFYDIRELKSQQCKGCRKSYWIEDFDNYKTCNHCRWRYKFKQYKKELNEKVDEFIYDINCLVAPYRLVKTFYSRDDIHTGCVIGDILFEKNLDPSIMDNIVILPNFSLDLLCNCYLLIYDPVLN